MAPVSRPASGSVTFGPFHLDLATGVVRKHGSRIHLQGQPLEILKLLILRDDHFITRDELKEALWSADTHVDFEHGLNSAVKRLRVALGDSGAAPRYVERVPRRGYRFIAQPDFIEAPPRAPAAELPPNGTTGDSGPREAPDQRVPDSLRDTAPSAPTRRRRWAYVAAVLTLALTASALVSITADPSSGEIRSIVVLPFDGASTDVATTHLAFGLTDTLTAELSRLGGLRVVSATSARWYKTAGKTVPQIARALGTDAVVEGSVLVEGDWLKVTVQLIDGVTDSHLWAENYTRRRGNLVALQVEIAQAVAREIRLKLTPVERTRLAVRSDRDPAVEQAFLEGRYYFSRSTEADWHRARLAFERVLTLDPNHAGAHAGLADVFLLTDRLPPSESFPLARQHALTALSLDDAQPGPYTTLGFIAYYGDWDWRGAEQALQRALAIAPNDSRALRWYARVAGALGRTEEALGYVKRAVGLDPASLAALEGEAAEEFRARHHERGLEIARQMLALDARDSRGYEQLITHSAMLSRYEACLAGVERSYELVGRAPHLVAIDTFCLARLNRGADAGRRARELDAQAQIAYVPQYFMALADIGRGRFEEAVNWLEHGYAARDPYMVELKTSPWLDPVRNDPRVREIMRKMKFPE